MATKFARVPYELFFFSECAKITCFAIHPFKPWLVAGHSNSSLSLWNYEEHTLLFEVNIYALEEENSKVLSQQVVEGTSGLGSGKDGKDKDKEKDKKLGSIKTLLFFDSLSRKHKILLDVLLIIRSYYPKGFLVNSLIFLLPEF